MNDLKDHLTALSTYPPFLSFKQEVTQRIQAYQLAPLDREGDIAAQALAREDAAKIIADIFSQVEGLARKEATSENTYE